MLSQHENEQEWLYGIVILDKFQYHSVQRSLCTQKIKYTERSQLITDICEGTTNQIENLTDYFIDINKNKEQKKLLEQNLKGRWKRTLVKGLKNFKINYQRKTKNENLGLLVDKIKMKVFNKLNEIKVGKKQRNQSKDEKTKSLKYT